MPLYHKDLRANLTNNLKHSIKNNYRKRTFLRKLLVIISNEPAEFELRSLRALAAAIGLTCPGILRNCVVVVLPFLFILIEIFNSRLLTSK